jgi:muconate cycloisomerase
VLIGREPGDIAGARAAMDARMYANHGAKAAIEIALHDLAGRATGLPVHALLGNKRCSRLPLLGVIGGGDFDGDIADAAAKKAKGFTAFKIKVGVDGPEKDAVRTRAICEVLGPDCLISADANQGFTTDQAIAFVRAVADTGLDFLEQPVAAHDLAGMAAVAAASVVACGSMSRARPASRASAVQPRCTSPP